eukprot:TRINITY_DN14843_c0_g1_i1.p1 TRINITY_DN14843_c0_g1~~TRINITY_DN14843_c0_g1_i1.p1  ORF type:complete len:165 (+),score=35.93 TRINITY_DN14843_c0_g1_i1:66-560(+)
MDKLFHAAAVNDAASIIGLLESGQVRPDVQHSQFYQRTAMHLAVMRKHERAVQALLNAKASPNVRDSFGECVVDIAPRYGLAHLFEQGSPDNDTEERIQNLKAQASAARTTRIELEAMLAETTAAVEAQQQRRAHHEAQLGEYKESLRKEEELWSSSLEQDPES